MYQNYQAFFRQKVQSSGNKIVLCDEKRDYSWKDIDRISSAMAQEMMRTGIRPGDRVALMGQNSVGLICAFWGIQKISATVFLFNHQFTDPEIKRELDKHSVPYLLLGHTAIPHQKAAFPPGVSVWDLEAVAQAQKTDGYREEEFSVLGEDTPSPVVFFTSGTTGEDKAVAVSEQRIFHSARHMAENIAQTASDSSCLITPFFHMLGFLSCFHSWIDDVCVCIPPSTRTQDVLQTVEKKKCTVMHAVPSMLTALSESDFLDQYDISSWRVSVVGGAAVAQGQAERLRQTFPGVDFLSGYGMSEVGFISSPTLVSSPEKRLVTVGKPPSDIRIRILAEEGKETTAGEIECAVAYPCYGYLSQGKAIALSQSRIRTGDIGLLDEEGNLVLTGRKKDVIVRGGEKIAPREIASVFSRMPGIKEAFVFGVPDDFWGEISVACLVPSGEESVTLEKVTAFAQGRLARYKIPDKIFFLKELPLLANGKIDRVRLYNDVAEHIAQSGIFINASERRKGNV